jgi:hypothetical protein
MGKILYMGISPDNQALCLKQDAKDEPACLN